MSNHPNSVVDREIIRHIPYPVVKINKSANAVERLQKLLLKQNYKYDKKIHRRKLLGSGNSGDISIKN
jgi:hypothetical protein